MKRLNHFSSTPASETRPPLVFVNSAEQNVAAIGSFFSERLKLFDSYVKDGLLFIYFFCIMLGSLKQAFERPSSVREPQDLKILLRLILHSSNEQHEETPRWTLRSCK